MKKFILSLALVLGMVSAKAQSTYTESFTIATATTITNLLNFGAKVTQIVVNNGVGNVATYNYAFLDSPLTNSISTNTRSYHVSAYTNWTSYRSNITKITTNYEGVFFTNTFTALVTVTNLQGATTNNYRTLVAGSSTATNTTTLDYANAPLLFAFGLTFTNTAANTSVVVTVTFDPSL